MFLRCTNRKKDGKDHRYWSVVESRRVTGGRIVQRHVLYLGEINDSQREAWRKTIEVFEDGSCRAKTMALFPEDRACEIDNDQVVQIRIGDVELRRPRQWGACWLACILYEQLGLERFWAERLPPSRKGTRWDLIVQALCCYRLIDPGSEWRLHRHWYETSAMADLLGAGFELVEIHKLYECLDRLLDHKRALFDHLTQRWKDLFNAKFDILLYDLTSTYFESSPPFAEDDKRKHGYSRDKRSDCVQVIIALIVTPEGFPLAYEVMAGNTADNTTLRGFLKKIEDQYGRADRIWVMDRGIPTEEVLREMRERESTRDHLLLKLGAARQQSPSAWRLVDIAIPKEGNSFAFSLKKDKLRQAMRREGRYLLRTNLVGRDPAETWEFYTQLTHVEAAFKDLKGDLAVRPIHHQKEGRIEAHIFVAFMAYALHVTLRHRLRSLAPGLTPRTAMEKFSSLQMIDIHLPTTDGRTVMMSRHTQPDPDLQILLTRLFLTLPAQPPPRMALKDDSAKHKT